MQYSETTERAFVQRQTITRSFKMSENSNSQGYAPNSTGAIPPGVFQGCLSPATIILNSQQSTINIYPTPQTEIPTSSTIIPTTNENASTIMPTTNENASTIMPATNENASTKIVISRPLQTPDEIKPFEQFGTFVGMEVFLNITIITYSTRQAALAAINAMHKKQINGHTLDVVEC